MKRRLIKLFVLNLWNHFFANKNNRINNTMNFLKLVLKLPRYESVCFLCFQDQRNTTNIHTEVEIIGDDFNLTFTLAKMLKTIVPTHEILSDQVCEDCTNLILKMFITLHKYNKNLSIIRFMLNNLDAEVNNIDPIKIEKVFIRLNTPEFKVTSIEKNCTSTEINDLVNEHKDILHKNSNNATVCDVCGQSFKTASSLKAHANCHKFKECPYCFKVLKSHSHFNIHTKRHTTAIKRKRNRLYYNCDTCNYVTVNKRTLEAHINKKHLNIRPYVCETCCKGFYKKSHLTEHSKTHQQIKNKTCEICGDHFVNNKTLNEHLRIHSDTKPYECSICDKKFITSGRRSDHMKRSHMEKTECCLYCDKKFSLKKELNRHVKKNHTNGTSALNDNYNVDISSYNSLVF